MKVFYFLGLILFFWIASFLFSSTTLKPFTTDGCSGPIPEDYFGNPWAWHHCCVKHDIYYWMGGSAFDRLTADEKLRDCIRETGHDYIAMVFYFSVRVFGHPKFKQSYRWGYGWPYPFPYHELDDEEKLLVLSSMNDFPQEVKELLDDCHYPVLTHKIHPVLSR